MTGVEFLEQIRQINIVILGLREEIENINTLLTNTTVKPKEVDVQTSLPSDPMADNIIKKVEYEAKLADAINKQIKIKTEALALIERMSADDKSVLILKYLNCKRVTEMAYTMEISETTVKSLLRRARLNFNELYDHYKTI